jgi:hypothetical protein
MVGHSSLFSQVLSLVNRHQFERRVREFGAEKRTKGFSCWSQFVSMMFCQLAQDGENAGSYRAAMIECLIMGFFEPVRFGVLAQTVLGHSRR